MTGLLPSGATRTTTTTTTDDRPMWVVAWTINHGENNLTDHFELAEGFPQAVSRYLALLEIENLHNACYAAIIGATEPHWMGQ